MFGKKNTATIMINSILGPGSELQGCFTAQGSARVDGSVNGDVKVTGTLIVGATGIINGNVEAEAVIIGGEVLGNVIAPKEAELTATARVLGDVSTKDIYVDEHADFQGRCNIYQDESGKEPQYVIPKGVKPSDRPVKRTAKEALQDVFREVREEKLNEGEEEQVKEAEVS